MPVAPTAETILEAFHSSLEHNIPREVSHQVSVESPSEVVTPDGQPSHWHVPVRVGERTVGFMDFSLDGTLIRHGSRIQQSSDLANLPPDLMDMNSTDMVTKARDSASPGAIVDDTPTLVADQSPTRLTWMLQGREADGKAFRVFVTPRFSWTEAVEAKPKDRE